MPEKLAQKIALHAFEIEGIDLVGKDTCIDIDILPNRPDCLSHIGIATEISAILNLPLVLNPLLNSPEPAENKKERVVKYLSVSTQDKNANPRYCARIVSGIKVGESPLWLRQRLETCGLRSINNIVDAANYVMLEYGQPLHCFDFDKIAGAVKKEIIVRYARKGEKMIGLDEKEYKLSEEILVIADTQKPLAIAGIKGGRSSEIDAKTQTIVIESANFDSHIIRRASRILGLRTDASSRFEHGLIPRLAETGANRLAELIVQLAGGEVYSGLADTAPQKEKKNIVKLETVKVEKLLGLEISDKDIMATLKRLFFNCKKGKAGFIEVEVPFWRQDIAIQEDLIEEIIRIFGYDKVAPQFPQGILVPPHKNDRLYWSLLAREQLRIQNFCEVLNYSFISEQEAGDLGFGEQSLIKLRNPLSSDFAYLRPTLLVNLLKNIANNQACADIIRIFEIGKQFEKTGKLIDPGKDEQVRLAAMVNADSKQIFYEMKGIVDTLLNGLGISDIHYIKHDCAGKFWENDSCAKIEVEGQSVGVIGLVSQDILNREKIINDVVAFDLDFAKVCQIANEDAQYREISKFPMAIRDVAILVPSEVETGNVLSHIYDAGNDWLQDVDLFDVYENEKQLNGKKSLAFHLVFQSQEKTLNSEEIDGEMKKIINNLEKNSGWEMRK